MKKKKNIIEKTYTLYEIWLVIVVVIPIVLVILYLYVVPEIENWFSKNIWVLIALIGNVLTMSLFYKSMRKKGVKKEGV